MPLERLGLIHTSATLVPIFTELCRAKLPGVEHFHIADDSLIRDVIAKGRLEPPTARRVVDHVAWAEQMGADAILVTCSSIGAVVEVAARLAGVPVCASTSRWRTGPSASGREWAWSRRSPRPSSPRRI